MAASFTRVQSTPLWTLDGAPGACAVAYAPFDVTGVPDALSLADSWSEHPGTYAVLPKSTTLDRPLADRLAAFRGGRPLRFAWVANPAEPAYRWDAWTIAAGATATTGLSGIGLRNIDLWVGADCPLAPGGDALDRIVIAPRAGDPGSLRLTAMSGDATYTTGGVAVTIPFSGVQAGCLVTATTLTDGGGADADFERLDVGMRVFARDASDKLYGDRLDSWRYPVLLASQPSTGVSLPVSVSIDPLRPLDGDRTFFGLVPADQEEGPELASHYVTTNGLAVHLVPRAPAGAVRTAAKLVLAVRALTNPPNPADPFYLVPSGSFRLKVIGRDGNEAVGAQRLLCGMSGIENVEIEPGCELWFSPRGAALASAQGLDSAATTAYASLYGANGAGGRTYRAQADAAALFKPTTQDGFMSFSELSGQDLPAAPTGDVLPDGYPLVPYTGIDDPDLARYRDFEYRALSPARRAAIALLESRPPAPARLAAVAATTPSVTPQGLLAGVDLAGDIASVQLVRSLDATGTPVDLVLPAITADLAAALQSNQLFLVASDPATLTGGSVTGTVTIPATPDGSQVWTIDAFPPAPWSDSGTLLVLKFAGKSLLDLARDTSTWATPDKFNPDGVPAAQQGLLAVIDEAIKRKDVEFQPFAKLAQEAAWQGILFLNAPVPATGMPPQIGGLAAGIDLSAFRAHHVGLTVTPIDLPGGTVTPKPSSLFGLVFYESPTTAAAAKGPYAFNVDTLKVRFENSTVATFASQIELLVDELFGEPSTLVDATTLAAKATNVILLEGVYQQQGASPGYTFSSTGDNFFEMTSAVLDSVDVASAQFVTVVAPDPKDDTKQAESRFLLAGALRFKALALDVFSYGPEAGKGGPSPQQLTYSNLAVEMTYVPRDREQDSYWFDATRLVPDPVLSSSRDAGLFADFPLTLTGFVHVPAAAPKTTDRPATPASLGFLGVGTDPQIGGTISAPWFGFVADLGLGSAGALAAQAGFKASLLAAWAPGEPGSANAGVGLKLPGTGSGGKLLSLESVLKLKIGDLSLSRHDGTWLLELDRIALSVLLLTIPPGGQVDALLFADPAGKDHTTLGWYAGYAKGGGK